MNGGDSGFFRAIETAKKNRLVGHGVSAGAGSLATLAVVAQIWGGQISDNSKLANEAAKDSAVVAETVKGLDKKLDKLEELILLQIRAQGITVADDTTLRDTVFIVVPDSADSI